MLINAIQQCSNGKNETYAQSILSNSFFLLTYLSKNVDHFNYSFPIQNEVRSESFSLSTTLFKKYYYKFSKSEYDSDNGFVFESLKPFTFYEYQGYYSDVSYTGLNMQGDSSYMFTSFHCHDYISKYKRTYTKVQTLLATMGSIFNVIFVLLKALTMMIASNILNVHMVNALFFKEQKKEKDNPLSNNNNNNSSIINMRSIGSDVRTRPGSSKMLTAKSSRKNMIFSDSTIITKPVVNQRRGKFKLQWVLYALPFTCYKNAKFNYLRELTHYLYYYLSIEQILPSVEKNADDGMVGKSERQFLFCKSNVEKSIIKVDNITTINHKM